MTGPFRRVLSMLGLVQIRHVKPVWFGTPDHTVAAPFPAEQGPELIGVAVLLHYLNRMVNVFLRDAPMPPGAPRFALGPVMRVLGASMRAAARHPWPAGASTDLLPAAALPPDL